MNYVSFWIFIFVGIFYLNTTFAGENVTLRVATYNIWNPIFEKKYSGKDSWSERKLKIVENILAANADLLFLQEVNQKAFIDLTTHHEIKLQYTSYYFPHDSSNTNQGSGRDGLAVFFKVSKLSCHQYFISQKGSRPTHRRDVYLDFELINHKKPIQFRAATTHLDAGDNLEIGTTQLDRLVHDILNPKEIANLDFVIVTGDFNEGKTEAQRPRAQVMKNDGFMTGDASLSTRTELDEVRHPGHVDWIYVKKLSSLPMTFDERDPIGNLDASDHKLLMTDFMIEQ